MRFPFSFSPENKKENLWFSDVFIGGDKKGTLGRKKWVKINEWMRETKSFKGYKVYGVVSTLISWCGNFVERRFARNYAETPFPQNFHTIKLGEITVFYAVYLFQNMQHWWELKKKQLQFLFGINIVSINWIKVSIWYKISRLQKLGVIGKFFIIAYESVLHIFLQQRYSPAQLVLTCSK